MYHKVDHHREVGINALPPERFLGHLSWLSENGYQSTTFLDILHRKPLPEKPVIISFDDGYLSVYENAFPAMQTIGFTGVIFVISGFAGKLNEWDVSLNRQRFRHLSPNHIRELAAAGWEIGAHSVTHRALPLLSETQVRREMQESREKIAEWAKQPVISFAYPFGIKTARERQLAKECGFQFGCKGVRGSQSIDVLNLPRIPVYQFETAKHLVQKMKHPLPAAERIKLSLLGLPAYLVPIYQFLFKQELSLDRL